MAQVRTLAGMALMVALGAAALVSTTDGAAAADDGGALTLAVYGDSPYGTSDGNTAQYDATPAFIDTVNTDPAVSSVVHVGDIHSGKQTCSEAYDQRVAALWTRFADPMVYTPGDNEWADCHKAGEGGRTASTAATGFAGGNPVANLDLVRSLFFPLAGRTLGGGSLHVQSQALHADRAHPGDAAYVENVMWTRRDVVFVTLNVPGGSNNDTDPWFGDLRTPAEKAQQDAEVVARTGADLRWVDRAFREAQEEGARAVVVVTQADLWDVDGKTPAHLTRYEPLVQSIASHTTAFGGPVLMVNGDSHVYRSDNPLAPTAGCLTEAGPTSTVTCASQAGNHPGYDVPNFHRIVVHGSTFPLEWLKLTIHEHPVAAGDTSFGPFSWSRQAQPQLTPTP